MAYAQSWSGLPPAVRAAFERQSKSLSYKRRQVVYEPMDEPDGIYFVETGLVGIVIPGRSGAEYLMRFFRPNQYFGHRSLFAEERFHARAIAIEDCEIAFVPKATVLWALDEYPVLQRLVMRRLAKELRRVERRWVEVLEHDVLVRAAQAIVYLQAIYPDHDWTRQEIANFCASTVSTVIRALARLEAQGLIKQTGRHIVVLDQAALIALQDAD